MKRSLSSRGLCRRTAFTLIELMVVVTIVAILATLSFSGYQIYLQKADRSACIAKMKNLYAGLSSYIVDHNEWPQEPWDEDQDVSDEMLWGWWYKEMGVYKISKEDWFCPAEMRLMRKSGRDAQEAGKDAMIDPSYIPAKMPPGNFEPFKYPRQPWVTEREDFHLDGQNKLMSSGKVEKEFNFNALSNR